MQPKSLWQATVFALFPWHKRPKRCELGLFLTRLLLDQVTGDANLKGHNNWSWDSLINLQICLEISFLLTFFSQKTKKCKRARKISQCFQNYFCTLECFSLCSALLCKAGFCRVQSKPSQQPTCRSWTDVVSLSFGCQCSFHALS